MKTAATLLHLALGITAISIMTLTTASAQASLQTDGEAASYQSPARPLGLNIVDPVMVGGSDQKASDFQSASLPSLQAFIQQNLGEGYNNTSVTSIDPSALTLATQADVRVYFVGELAGYRNTLGFNTTGGAVTPSSDSKLIFPDVTTTGTVRNASSPLLPGDFVNLGRYDAGTTLDFFTISNGANNGSSVFTAHPLLNPDQRQHMVAFALPSSPFLLIGFEDTMNGGDNDFNDVLFAVDIGKANQESLAGSEPGTMLLMAGFLTTTIAARRRKTAVAHA